jgi:NADPH:quinone reductase-like Zn-dependent oxidoreductase
MKVLINGAGGGVGTIAVQIAKALGAEVTAVCSESKATVVKRMGADVVVNYHREDIFKSAKKFDVILNCVRGSNFVQWKKLLTKEGKQIVIAANPNQLRSIKLSNLFSSKKSIIFHVRADGNALKGISELISAQKVKPIISKTFALNALIRAHRLFETEGVAGKISIAMNGHNSL